MNASMYFCRPSWKGDKPIARPLPAQNSSTQKKRDSNSRSQCSGGPRPRGHLELPEHY
jgi:hypothetical protein